jgi:hypothetical protein
MRYYKNKQELLAKEKTMKCLHCHLVTGMPIYSVKLQKRIRKFLGSGSSGIAARLASGRR